MPVTTTPPTTWMTADLHREQTLAALQAMTTAELNKLSLYLVDLNTPVLADQDSKVTADVLVEWLGSAGPFKGFVKVLPNANAIDFTVGDQHWLYGQPNKEDNGLYEMVEVLPGVYAWEYQFAEANIAPQSVVPGTGTFVPQAGWTGGSDAIVDKAFDSNATTQQELADVLAAVIQDLKTAGIFTA